MALIIRNNNQDIVATKYINEYTTIDEIRILIRNFEILLNNNISIEYKTI